MKTQYTKGEWRQLSDTNYPIGEYSQVRSIHSHGKYIAIMLLNHKGNMNEKDQRESEANAKLITAAPELLSAVSRLIDPLTGKVYVELIKCLRNGDIKAAETAYKKATE